jgi:predicted secreted acid phosphatase
MFIRDQWIQNTQFFQDSNDEVLRKVVDRVRVLLEAKKLPIIVFDLDSTLFDVSKRTFQILKEWMAHPDTRNFHDTHAVLSSLTAGDLRYSLEELWESKSIPHAKAPFDHHFKHAKQFWRKRFFGHEYLRHDEPMNGAIEFVRNLHEMGAMIVYLTGRDVPQMAFGTYDQLKLHGLPIEVDRTRLILKPKRHMEDIEYKSAAAKSISEWGEVVASFENEPKNLVAMAKSYKPETMNIFLHTVSSDHPAPGGKDIYKIQEFKIRELK